MFGLGMPEILLILAIALIVIGPKKLPDLAKTLGRAMGEFKRAAQDFKRSIDVETTVKDLKDIEIPKTDLKDILKDVNSKAETGSTVKEDIFSKTSEKPIQGDGIRETQDDKNPAAADHLSENKKFD